MAAETTDPQSFKEWDEAFQYPIPNVRKFEARLRSHADENRQKLRTLVGASYRDLLGTADRIIEMDTQMQLVETSLSNIGQKSNSRAAETLFSNYAKFAASTKTLNQDRNALAAHIAILRSCSSVITKFLKQQSSPLTASKVLVLARLTFNLLSKQQLEPPPLLVALQTRLGSLRRKLLDLIDRRLANPDTEWHTIVDDMCAFSLATSATPTDVLRHFHTIRLKTIEQHLASEDNVREHALNAVQLLVRTLQISQIIFPRRLSDALARLKDLPLLQQRDLRKIDDLNLELHERWLAPDLRNYTPQPRHDELQKPESDRQLRAWGQKAQKSFLAGLETSLSNEPDFSKVLQLRKGLFEVWPWTDSRVPGIDSSSIDSLRDLFNERLSAIINAIVASLRLLPQGLQSTLEGLAPNNSGSTSLWNPALVSADARDGASTFKTNIIRSYRGEDEAVSQLIKKYEKWLANVAALEGLLKEMRDTRWEDDFTDDIDDAGLDSRQTLLSQDDPRTVKEALTESLASAYSTFRADVANIVKDITGDQSHVSATASLLVIRVIRGLLQRSVPLGPGQKSLDIESSTVTALLSILAKDTINLPCAQYKTSIQSLVDSHSLLARPLWEGSPPLPAQPSSAAFRFLRQLSDRMAASGADVWASGATVAVKQQANKALAEIIQTSADKLSEQVTNGHKDEGSSSNEAEVDNNDTIYKDKLVALLFDQLYLRKALDSGTATQDADKLELGLVSSSHLDNASVGRLKKGVLDYWKRTYLLFALLSQE